MACAPSTMVMMPRARAVGRCRTGKSWPDWFVMWQKCITLVWA